MLHEVPIDIARWFQERKIILPYWFARFQCQKHGIDRIWISDSEQEALAEAEGARIGHGGPCA